jgi:hypothetical protein
MFLTAASEALLNGLLAETWAPASGLCWQPMLCSSPRPRRSSLRSLLVINAASQGHRMVDDGAHLSTSPIQ